MKEVDRGLIYMYRCIVTSEITMLLKTEWLHVNVGPHSQIIVPSHPNSVLGSLFCYMYMYTMCMYSSSDIHVVWWWRGRHRQSCSLRAGEGKWKTEE